jgi:hypothetical protein
VVPTRQITGQRQKSHNNRTLRDSSIFIAASSDKGRPSVPDLVSRHIVLFEPCDSPRSAANFSDPSAVAPYLKGPRAPVMERIFMGSGLGSTIKRFGKVCLKPERKPVSDRFSQCWHSHREIAKNGQVTFIPFPYGTMSVSLRRVDASPGGKSPGALLTLHSLV